jgi:hypothetical protein
MGKKVILTPILVMLGFTLLSILLYYLKANPARFLSGGIEMILPIATGVIVGTVVSYDPALELQLTLPRKYQTTGMQRLLLIVGWSVLIAFISTNVIDLLKLRYMFQPSQLQSALMEYLVRQLVWLAPLLWCVGLGLCFALIMRSRSAAGALLGAIWIAEIIFKDWIALTPWLRPVLLFPTTLLIPPTVIPQYWYDVWLSSRFELIATGLVLLPIGWLLLHNSEGLLKSMSED